MLPDFKSKILTQLLDAQKDNGPLLFSLMSKCFQDVGLTKWTSIIAKQCPDNADCTKATIDKCIRDYLVTVFGVPNIGRKLICWLCTAKKPALMPMHEFMWRQVQHLSYLEGGYLCQLMKVPMAQEKSEKIFFAQPKAHQNKFVDLNKIVPTNPLKTIAFFEQCQATSKAAGILKKIAKDKKQPKKMKMAQLPVAVAVNQAIGSILVVNIATTIKVTNTIATVVDLTIVIKTINTTIALNAMTMTQRSPSPTTRRMIASAITPRKRVTRPCTMTSPLC